MPLQKRKPNVRCFITKKQYFISKEDTAGLSKTSKIVYSVTLIYIYLWISLFMLSGKIEKFDIQVEQHNTKAVIQMFSVYFQCAYVSIL